MVSKPTAPSICEPTYPPTAIVHTNPTLGAPTTTHWEDVAPPLNVFKTSTKAPSMETFAALLKAIRKKLDIITPSLLPNPVKFQKGNVLKDSTLSPSRNLMNVLGDHYKMSGLQLRFPVTDKQFQNVADVFKAFDKNIKDKNIKANAADPSADYFQSELRDLIRLFILLVEPSGLVANHGHIVYTFIEGGSSFLVWLYLKLSSYVRSISSPVICIDLIVDAEFFFSSSAG